MDYQFKFCDDGKVKCFGFDESDVIMSIWIEDGSICIVNKTDCDDIQIPSSVILKLILDYDQRNIRSQLKNYLEKE